MAPLSRLPDYEVADKTPNVRGWTVTTTDGGSVGPVEYLLVNTERMDTRYLIVRLGGARPSGASGESARLVPLPVERAHLDDQDERVQLNVTRWH